MTARDHRLFQTGILASLLVLRFPVALVGGQVNGRQHSCTSLCRVPHTGTSAPVCDGADGGTSCDRHSATPQNTPQKAEAARSRKAPGYRARLVAWSQYVTDVRRLLPRNRTLKISTRTSLRRTRSDDAFRSCAQREGGFLAISTRDRPTE